MFVQRLELIAGSEQILRCGVCGRLVAGIGLLRQHRFLRLLKVAQRCVYISACLFSSARCEIELFVVFDTRKSKPCNLAYKFRSMTLRHGSVNFEAAVSVTCNRLDYPDFYPQE
jgi:hypothetical protein